MNNLNNIFIKLIVWYLSIMSEFNPPTIPEFYYFPISSHLNITQCVQNAYKLIVIAKIDRFNSLFEDVIICMKTIHRSQKKIICLVYSWIELLNTFKIYKALKKDSTYRIFTIKCV